MTNPSAVTRILGNSGEPISRKQPARIKHLQEHTAGFRSEGNNDNTVNLYFLLSSFLRSDNDEIRSKLETAEALLGTKGYSVERKQWQEHQPYLLVEKVG